VIPVAIVGIGCRFPGASNLQEYWHLLRNGIDAISEVPADRWDIEKFYHPKPGTPGKMNTRYGGFIDQVDKFDPDFFGISPREAERMDPQQRLVLEVAWEALENAGIPPSHLSGSQTGVIVGIGNYDHGLLLSQHLDQINAYDGTGNTISIAATRLSYILNLRGPSLTTETACSSSLVALHLACQSLRTGETDQFIVGAISLMLSPQQTITYSNAAMMAADGRCKTFDASANGYVRGEGCGVVVLKRLDDAIANGDNIQAIIRGSAVNQDGLSNGMTAPSALAQQIVIRQALENAGVKPAQISYVEAHGTGTSLGDPIEVRSLKAVLMQGRSLDQPCYIGSVKTNIGHLEAAAGMAGLIKVILALQYQEIPPHLNFKQLNPLISFDGTPFSIPTQLQPWNSITNRFAGISSFGFGGTNAHVILEEAPKIEAKQELLKRPLHLLTLSTKSETALGELVKRYQSFLAEHPESDLANICFTANTGREHFKHRLAVLADSTSQLADSLTSFTQGQEIREVVSGLAQSTISKIAFLFTGQGSQYGGMGLQLYKTQPIFKKAIDDCEEILRPYLQIPLSEILYYQAQSKINETIYTQPALFAIEYALYQLWKSWGIQPSLVMGHSVGEYVAACVAGVFSLEDGLKLIAARGRLMQSLPQDGGMVAVMATVAVVEKEIEPYQNQVSIAAVNGENSLVISGEKQALEQICQNLEAIGVKTKPLQVSHAFHSPLMQPMLAEFAALANQINYSIPKIKLISNLTGLVAGEEIATAAYWCNHITNAVQFARSMDLAQGYEVFVEIGPKPILLGMGRQCLNQNQRLWLPSLRPNQDDWQVMLESLAQLYLKGSAIDWRCFDVPYYYQRQQLPTYPFERHRYWVDVKANNQTSNNSQGLDINQTAIVNLIQQGNIEQLTQELSTEFSVAQTQYLPKFLEVLVKKHQQQLKSTSIQDWLYQLEWQLQPRHQNSEKQLNRNGIWLIFADSQGLGQSLALELEREGNTCLLVYAGESYQHLSTGSWSINPSCITDFQRLLAESNLGEIALQGVIHLWSLETTLVDLDLSTSTLEQAQILSCGSALHLIQTLTKQNNLDGEISLPRLWLITRGVISVDSTNSTLPGVFQSPLWGMGKVLTLEHPQLWGGMVDLPPEPMENEAIALLTEILDSQAEDYLALRSQKRYVARLQPSNIKQPQMMVLSANSTYLITGGLGALGLKVAQWMVEQGARYLVLTGRHQASKQSQEAILQMESVGTKVLQLQADVSNKTDMMQVFAMIKESMPPLQGIIHAAGAVGYQSIIEMDLSTFISVLRPKALGGWILHQLTQDMKLDFFVGFSSIASVWGSKGQSHYAAANHFLDTLANYRHSLGLPGLSINWGPWAEVGMAAGEAQLFLNRMGVKGLQPEKALTALGVLLGGSSSQMTVVNVDWNIFQSIYEAREKRSLLKKIKIDNSDNTYKKTTKQSDILQKIEAAGEGDRESILIAYLQAEVGNVLGTQLPDTQRGFFDMGMDSLMAVDLKTRLETNLNIYLPTTLIFEFPTIKDLAEFLIKDVFKWQSLNTESIEIEDKQDSSLLEIEQLSEDEVEASIAERLAQLEILIGG
jgi:acyl transferase domain-containing protein/acyl carrier protein